MPSMRRGQVSSTTKNSRVNTESTPSKSHADQPSRASRHITDHDSAPATRSSKRRRTGSNADDTPKLNALDERSAFPSTELLASDDNQDGQWQYGSPSDLPDHNPASSVTAEPSGQLDPEMTKAISDIIDHSERFEQYCAASAGNDVSLTEPKHVLFAQPGSRIRIESLSILDNLSSQILFTLGKSSYHDIVTLLREKDSGPGQEYATVRSLFDHTKRLYSSKSAFLSSVELDMFEPSHVETIRRANLATFVSSIFGSQEIGFAELDDRFLDIFVPENGRLLKAQGSLYLDLKTQAFISGLKSGEGSRTEMLYTLFPDDMGAKITARRPGTRNLAPSEQDFVKRAFSRREILLADVNDASALEVLPKRYQWDDFLRDVSSYILKNFDSLNPQAKLKSAPTTRAPNGVSRELDQKQLQSNFPVKPVPQSDPGAALPRQEDFVAKAARAAQIALQSHNISIPAPGPPRIATHPAPKPFFEQEIQLHTNFQQYVPPATSSQASPRGSLVPEHSPLPNLPHVSQSAPTQVLYERARQATTPKSTPATPRSGLPSHRRPWTTEEENALMAGLDRVRGPHWSQILALFGAGGTVNESLKDRSQVQLKDKARNLKLFFLKSGIEVPYYLKYVTGDLKTRAPGQASRNEAREGGKQQDEEDKAHFHGVQGIMALADVNPPEHQQQQQQQPPPPPQENGHASEPILQVDDRVARELQNFDPESDRLWNTFEEPREPFTKPSPPSNLDGVHAESDQAMSPQAEPTSV